MENTVEHTDAGGPDDQDDEPTVVVSLPRDAYERVVGVEAVHTTEYGSVVWLELAQSDFEELQAAEVEFEVRDATVISLGYGEYSFDPRVGEPSLPEELTSDYDEGIPGLYLVQLYGPPKDEWFDKLETEGVENLRYTGAEAHLVRMMPGQTTKVESLDFIRWVGPYHPAYRISPYLLAYTGTIENVSVTIYDDGQIDGTVDRTIEAIETLNGTLLDRYNSSASIPEATTIFILPALVITSVAQLNDVIWVEYESPESVPLDEMSNQILAGSGVAAGYEARLQVQPVDALMATLQGRV